jgi:hypothetical protein
MKPLLIGVTAALTIAVTGPVLAQVPPPGAGQPWPPATYSAGYQSYGFPAPTPRDAYREGLINRWQLEQLEGPTPQALQGPSVDSSKSEPGG